MTDEESQFPTFLRGWLDKNLGSLGDHTDPSDHEFYYGRRAERLREDAGVAGFSIEVETIARSTKGGLHSFIEHEYDRAEFRRRHGDI
jgi:hypothetical protein